MLPFTLVFCAANKRIIAKEVTDFPEPDSPTIPTILPLGISNEIPLTAS